MKKGSIYSLVGFVLLTLSASPSQALREGDTLIMIRDAQSTARPAYATAGSTTINGTLECFKTQADDTIVTSRKTNCMLQIRDHSGEAFGLKSGEVELSNVAQAYREGARNVSIVGTPSSAGWVKVSQITYSNNLLNPATK